MMAMGTRQGPAELRTAYPLPGLPDASLFLMGILRATATRGLCSTCSIASTLDHSFFSSQNPQNRHLPKEPLLVILKYHTSNWAQSSLGFPNNHLNNRMPLWEVEGILQPYL